MTRLNGARIVLGVTGGIAAYKAAALARLLVGAGAQVDVVLTRGGAQFIGAPTFEGITGRPVRSEVWESISDDTHVALGQTADVVVIYPATAHVMAKMAAGLADDLLTTSVLVARCPVIVAPAMHTEMWTHPATRANVALLTSRQVNVLGPDVGPLMGGDQGPGRVVEPAVALVAVTSALDHPDHFGAPRAEGGPAHGRPSAAEVVAEPAADFAGRQLIVTAGGTREPIDPVRFIGNRSSGKMGFALAEAAAQRGATVTLIAAPSTLTTPAGVDRIDVTTALEMHDAVMSRSTEVDVIIKAAAVADYRPADMAATKMKKDEGPPTLTLAPNPDILAELGTQRATATRPVLIGFAAETDNVERNARDKIARKGADLLVVNDVSRDTTGFEVDTNEVSLLWRDGTWRDLPSASKREIADRILDEVVHLLDLSDEG
ncbi:MAG: bifunctional phosphopantothenoylcysteine decarboxylase/phosphopantothenate--cysteine ligase CoaBC [Nitriliruptoraceae bacterium]